MFNKLFKIVFFSTISIIFLLLVSMQVLYINETRQVKLVYDTSLITNNENVKIVLIILSILIIAMYSIVTLFGTSRVPKKYQKLNYNRLLTKIQRKRGTVRVIYDSEGNPTRKSIWVYLTNIIEPITRFQNKICDHFHLPLAKKWNTNKEYKVHKNIQHHIAGIPIMAFRRFWIIGKFCRVYYLTSRVHTLFVGATGRGKSWTYVIPMIISCLQSGENAVVVDVKKELYYHTHELARSLGYKLIKLDFIDPEKGDGWNPLEYPYSRWKKALLEDPVDTVEVKLHVVTNVETVTNMNQVRLSAGITSADDELLMLHAKDIYVSKDELRTLNKQEIVKRSSPEFYKNNKKANSKVTFNLLRYDGGVVKETVRNLNYEIVEDIKDLEIGTHNITIAALSYHKANVSEAVEMVLDIAKTMTFQEDARDPFWHLGAGDMLAGGALLSMENGVHNKVNFTSVRYIYEIGMKKNLLENYLAEYREVDDNSTSKMATYLTAEGMTRSSLKSVFQNAISLITATEDIRKMTSQSTFSFEELRDEKTIVYLQVHDEKTTYYPLVVIFLKQLYEAIIKISRDNPKYKFKRPMNWYLDEFAQFPEIKDIEAIYGAARSRGVNIHAFIQSEDQLVAKYEERVAKIIKDNSANIIYLGSSEEGALLNAQKAAGNEAFYNIEQKKWDERPVIRAEALSKFEKGRSLIKQMEFNPFISKLPPYDEYTFYSEPNFEEEEIPKAPVDYFNIQDEYISSNKKAYTEEGAQSISSFGDLPPII